MSIPKPRSEPDDEPMVDWEDFERASNLIVADQRPKQRQQRHSSRHDKQKGRPQ